MESLNINKYNKEEVLIIFKIYLVLGEEMKKIILAAVFCGYSGCTVFIKSIICNFSYCIGSVCFTKVIIKVKI